MLDGRVAVRAIAVCAVALAGIGVGYIEGQRSTDSPALGQVDVSIIYDRHGSVVDVDLTDSRGRWIPAGPITESRPNEEN